MKRYQINVTAEPANLHEDPAQPGQFISAAAVHVVPDTRVADGDAVEAIKILEAFLTPPAPPGPQIPKLFAVTVEKNAAGTGLVLSAPVELTRAETGALGAGPDVMNWLTERQPKQHPNEEDTDFAARRASYWTGNQPATPGDDTDVNHVHEISDNVAIPAMDLLRASINWPAPLPHRAGLMHLALGLPSVSDDQRLIIFPWWDTDTAPSNLQLLLHNGHEPADFPENDAALNLKVNGGAIHFTTTFVQAFQPVEAKGSQNGWIEPGQIGTADIKRLRRVRAEFSGSLDAFAPLLAFRPTEDADKATFGNWLTTNGEKLLFDQLDLSLSKIKEDNGRLCDALSGILSEVAQEDGLQLTDPSTWIAAVPDINQILDELGLKTEDAVAAGPGPSPQDQLDTAVSDLNALALAMNDPEQLRTIVAAFLRQATKQWQTVVAALPNPPLFDTRATEAFEAFYAAPGADLAADIREDAADALMDKVLRDIVIAAFATAPADPADDTRLRDALNRFDWIKKRVFDAPLPGLLRPMDGLAIVELTDHLNEIYGAAVDDLLSTRFTPDREPQPLTIVATDQLDPSEFDTIASQITGFGLMIGATHPDYSDLSLNDSWGFANGVSLTMGNTHIPFAIEPSTLAPNYGQIEMTLTYNGLPQIGRAVARPVIPDPIPMPYDVSHAAFEEAPIQGRAPLMPLAYGFAYHAVPFYLPNSGTLPRALHDGSLHNPIVTDTAAIPKDPVTDVYWRTTPVATVSIANTPGSVHPGIGFVPKDVVPIAPDLLKAAQDGKALTGSIPDNPGLLLLGHADRPATAGKRALSWLPELRQGAQLTISAPRVSFEDFDRWVANPMLRDAVTGLTLDHVDAIEDARDAFEHVEDALASELINRLPDPAVSKLRVHLQVFDRLWGSKRPSPDALFIAVTPYGEIPSLAGNSTAPYAQMIRAIDRAATFALNITSDLTPGFEPSLVQDDTNNVITATVAPGDICVLTVCPLVHKGHYGTGGCLRAFDPRFEETGIIEDVTDDFACLKGTALLIEAMDAPLDPVLATTPNDLRFDAMHVLADGRDRGFSLQLCPDFANTTQEQAIYRAFGDVDLHIHQARSTGMPIPDWIDPRQKGKDPDPNSPVVEIAYDEDAADRDGKVDIWDGTGDVARFEAAAFFDRPLYDGERRRIKLPTFVPKDPKANAVTLDRVSWTSPAATYLRYAQSFRSRYIGAMASDSGTMPAVGPNRAEAKRLIAPQFTKRVAILADMSGDTIVAPQLRHILPSLDGARDEGAPLPFVASLGERPFDQYGLADRIVPSVTAIQTFTLAELARDESGLTEARLRFDTYRKEIGPDPRTRIHGLSDPKSANVRLRAEGPVGHHFDPPEADAPGFVNTSYLLHLEGLSPDWVHDQMFAAIELRRLVDPAWAFILPERAEAALKRAWSVPLDTARLGFKIRHKAETQPSVLVASNDDALIVSINRLAAYEDPTLGGETFAELCRLPKDGGTYHLIHRDLGKSSFEVLILRTGPRAGSHPQVMADARYKADGTPDLETLTSAPDSGQNRDPNQQQALPDKTPVQISASTGAQWALSGYDMGHVCLGAEIAPMTEAAAILDDAELRFETHIGEPRRLAPRDAVNPEPVGVHAYFAAIPLSRSPNAGRQVLLPQEAVMLDPIGRATLSRREAIEQALIFAFGAPAQPLGVGETVTFDLEAVQPPTRPTDLLLRFRIAKASGLGTQPLRLTLGPKSPNRPADNEEVKQAVLTLQPADLAGLNYLDIRVSAQGTLVSVHRYTDDPSGVSSEIPLTGSEGEVGMTDRAIQVTRTENADLTMDVSMIPELPPKPGMWNWDWVFPPVATAAQLRAAETAQQPQPLAQTQTAGPAPLSSAVRAAAISLQREAVLAPLGMSRSFPVKHIAQ